RLDVAGARDRVLSLGEVDDAGGNALRMLLAGKRWSDPVSERPRAGSVETWSFVNLSGGAHPGARPAAVRSVRVERAARAEVHRARATAAAARVRLEGHRARRPGHGHAHRGALRGRARPLRVALPSARTRGQRDDAAVRVAAGLSVFQRTCRRVVVAL